MTYSPDFDRDLPDPGEDAQGDVPCPACDGRGYEHGPDGLDECRRCDGAGTVTGSLEEDR